MAYQDALFQLGMDLTRSSTAQEEDHGERAPVAHLEKQIDLVERTGTKFTGTHLIVDLIGARRLDDLEHIEATLKRCVDVAGAKLLHIHLHQVAPGGGVSGIAVLAEGQISILSRKPLGFAALDVFMGGKANPHVAIDVLKEAFRPTRTVVKEHLRTNTMKRSGWDRAPKRTPAREKARAAA